MASCLLWPAIACAGDLPETRNMFGELGLLDMPSSRMADDGELSITYSGLRDGRRVSLGFQALPWLEGSFRYSEILHGLNDQGFDRSFGLKFRLFQETRDWPELSVGIRDAIGTGIYGAEYIVASKAIGDVDLTAGLGWGRLAGRSIFANPFGLIAHSFDNRTRPTGQGGNLDFGQLFHGPHTGFFGGAAWQTPIRNLGLTVEYSSDRYTFETAHGGFHETLPFNFGLNYAPLDNIGLMAGWFYGNTFGGAITLAFNPAKPLFAHAESTPLPKIAIRSDKEQANAVSAFVMTRAQPLRYGTDATASLPPGARVERDGRTLIISAPGFAQGAQNCARYGDIPSTDNIGAIALMDMSNGSVVLCPLHKTPDHAARAAYIEDNSPDEFPVWPADTGQTIRADADTQGLRIEALSPSAHELTVYYGNTRYEIETDAMNRLLRVLMKDAPPSIEMFRLVPVVDGMAMQEVRVARASLERMFTVDGAASEIAPAIAIHPAAWDNPALDENIFADYPRFSWALSPGHREGFFDPSAPLRYQIYALLSGDVELFRGFKLESSFDLNIYNNFSDRILSDSVLPHVRSDVAQYLTKGATGFSTLDASFHTRLAPDLFAEVKAGYLEDMFAGAGAQILWRPQDARWAVGGDLYEVWQRDYDRFFGLQHYHVLTGHVSLYYQSPWHGVNIAVHAGRYLAGDYGATLEISRRFLSDAEIGVFATLTNVPFAKFGEGSFDKGIIIHIPIEWALPYNTQSSYDLTLRPLTRDGGQRLDNDDSLYDETRRTSYGDIENQIDRIGAF